MNSTPANQTIQRKRELVNILLEILQGNLTAYFANYADLYQSMLYYIFDQPQGTQQQEQAKNQYLRFKADLNETEDEKKLDGLIQKLQVQIRLIAEQEDESLRSSRIEQIDHGQKGQVDNKEPELKQEHSLPLPLPQPPLDPVKKQVIILVAPQQNNATVNEHADNSNSAPLWQTQMGNFIRRQTQTAYRLNMWPRPLANQNQRQNQSEGQRQQAMSSRSRNQGRQGRSGVLLRQETQRQRGRRRGRQNRQSEYRQHRQPARIPPFRQFLQMRRQMQMQERQRAQQQSPEQMNQGERQSMQSGQEQEAQQGQTVSDGSDGDEEQAQRGQQIQLDSRSDSSLEQPEQQEEHKNEGQDQRPRRRPLQQIEQRFSSSSSQEGSSF